MSGNSALDFCPLLKEWEIFCVRFKDHVTSRSVTPQEGSDSILLFAAGSASESLMCMAQQYSVDGQVLGKILKCVEETCLPKVIRLFDRFKWYAVKHSDGGSVSAFSEAWADLADNTVEQKDGDVFFQSDTEDVDDDFKDIDVSEQQDSNHLLQEKKQSMKTEMSKKYTCQKCDITYLKLSSLDSHIYKKHRHDKDHVCKHCGQYFEDIIECKKHTRAHRMENLISRSVSQRSLIPGTIRCGLCGHISQSVHGFRGHRFRKHYDDRDCICKYCGDYYENMDDMNEHYKVHTEKKHLPARYRDFTRNNSKTQNYDEDGEILNLSEEDATPTKQFKASGDQEDQKPVQCGVCGKRYKLTSRLKQHILQMHAARQNMICHLCGSEFEKASTCKEHMKTHGRMKKIYSFSLNKSKRSYVSSEQLQDEESDAEDVGENSPPQSSSVRNNSRYSLRKSKSSMSSEQPHNEKPDTSGQGECVPQGPITCGLCETVLSSKRTMLVHIKTLHSKVQDHLCACCGQYFDNPENCLHHQSSQTARSRIPCAPEGARKCGLCGSLLGSKYSLQTHIRSKHAKVQDHMCAYCGQYFEDPEECLQHQRKPSLTCDFCPETFKTKYLRDTHVNKQHQNRKDHQCDLCGSRFFYKSELNIHRRRHHNALKCPKCDKVLCSRSSLKFHMRVHNNERPYICDVCGKGFVQPTTLKVHKGIHTGNKPFACEICGKRTRTKADMTRHMPVHSDKKQFVCEICGKAYRFQSGLFSHKFSHNSLRPHVCKICGCTYRSTIMLRVHAKTHEPGAKKSRPPKVPRVPVPPLEETKSEPLSEKVAYASHAQSEDSKEAKQAADYLNEIDKQETRSPSMADPVSTETLYISHPVMQLAPQEDVLSEPPECNGGTTKVLCIVQNVALVQPPEDELIPSQQMMK